MTVQDHNPIFEQWLMAYGSHLEEVAQGAAKTRDGNQGNRPTSSMPKDSSRKG